MLTVRDLEGVEAGPPSTVAVGRPAFLAMSNDAGSPTRRMLMLSDRRHRRNLIILGSGAALLSIALCTGLVFQLGWISSLARENTEQKEQAEELKSNFQKLVER